MKRLMMCTVLALIGMTTGCVAQSAAPPPQEKAPGWPTNAKGAVCSVNGRFVAFWAKPDLIATDGLKGKIILRVRLQDMENPQLVLSDDGETVIAFDPKEKDVSVWEVRTGNQIPFQFRNREVEKYYFSQNGMEIFAKIKGGAEVFSAQTGKFLREVKH